MYFCKLQQTNSYLSNAQIGPKTFFMCSKSRRKTWETDFSKAEAICYWRFRGTIFYSASGFAVEELLGHFWKFQKVALKHINPRWPSKWYCWKFREQVWISQCGREHNPKWHTNFPKYWTCPTHSALASLKSALLSVLWSFAGASISRRKHVPIIFHDPQNKIWERSLSSSLMVERWQGCRCPPQPIPSPLPSKAQIFGADLRKRWGRVEDKGELDSPTLPTSPSRALAALAAIRTALR